MGRRSLIKRKKAGAGIPPSLPDESTADERQPSDDADEAPAEEGEEVPEAEGEAEAEAQEDQAEEDQAQDDQDEEEDAEADKDEEADASEASRAKRVPDTMPLDDDDDDDSPAARPTSPEGSSIIDFASMDGVTDAQMEELAKIKAEVAAVQARRAAEQMLHRPSDPPVVVQSGVPLPVVLAGGGFLLLVIIVLVALLATS